MRRTAVVVAGALLVVGLSSCAGAAKDSGPAATSVTSRPATAAPSSATDSVTLDGQLQDGVQPGCTVLRADDGISYVLTGAATDIPFGVPVEVRGVLQSGVLSYCNSGATVQVLSITRQ